MSTEKETLQASGEHPAPCARHCEAVAFEIEIRRLTAERDAMAARLAELDGQEPVAWVYDWQAPEGLIKGWVETNRDAIPEDATNIRPLYARPIWNVRREGEDRCDMELEDLGTDHSVWEEASEVASILEDAGIEVAE